VGEGLGGFEQDIAGEAVSDDDVWTWKKKLFMWWQHKS
jgi:hypothetical protein